jgi:hypothetical protein
MMRRIAGTDIEMTGTERWNEEEIGTGRGVTTIEMEVIEHADVIQLQLKVSLGGNVLK